MSPDIFTAVGVVVAGVVAVAHLWGERVKCTLRPEAGRRWR